MKKFAALALMAVVLFSDDAEAKKRGGKRGGKGKKRPADAVCDIEVGKLELFQGVKKNKRNQTSEVKPIWAKIELEQDAAPVEPTLQIFNAADCGGSEVVDSPVSLNVKTCEKTEDEDQDAI